jgi:hypothetical protein
VDIYGSPYFKKGTREMSTLFLIAKCTAIVCFIVFFLFLIGTEIYNEIRIKRIVRKAQEK